MADYFEYYITNDNMAAGIPVFDVGDALCQTFTSDTAHTITQIRLKLYRVSTPGILHVSVYAVDGDHFPIGASLASGTTDGDTLTTSSSGSFRDIILGTTAALQADTEYAIVLTAPNGIPGSATVLWRIDSSGSTYTNGWATKYLGVLEDPTPQIWQIFSDDLVSDFMFVEYGNIVSLPEQPINPIPIDTASNVTLDHETIVWEDGGGATSYNVYYGEDAAGLTLVSAGQAGLSFTISGIDYGSPFDYVISRTWRIDAINADGVTPGNEWTFTTIVFDQLRISYVLIPGGSGAGPYDSPPGVEGTDWSWTGENNMLTVKRLVAVAKDAVFYEDV